MRSLELLIVSALARVEVAAAIWRKERANDLTVADAEVLAGAFEADWFGGVGQPPRFAAVALLPNLLEQAAQLTATHGLRAVDAIQLASALAARDADPECRVFACFDEGLRDAAARSGFSLVPERLEAHR